MPEKKHKTAPTNEPNASAVAIGAKIRRRRREIEMTLQEVADRVQLSVGFLSQVERGQSTPSLSSLCAIAQALDSPVDAFVISPRRAGVVSRSGERERFHLGDENRTYELLGIGFPGAKLNGCLVHRAPGKVTEVMRVDGEEIAYVLKGTVLYEIDGERHILKPGDSIHFKTDKPHRTATLGDEDAIELYVSTLPFFI
ncbi:cupin domain-containing protein [Aminobacter sp. AP02]|uniref:helix-turn-helix domain-containing protein n=1 Tax=Aminobacter sp. AP02 TaxID=2135737 RepID=UPI000D7A5611|nr:cupin domain-containing protein [Aminobacter sp. AP02]PWK73971.1 quercetin dioxygenase-like cupin family protein [Aminobacter sp. AP02]